MLPRDTTTQCAPQTCTPTSIQMAARSTRGSPRSALTLVTIFPAPTTSSSSTLLHTSPTLVRPRPRPQDLPSCLPWAATSLPRRRTHRGHLPPTTTVLVMSPTGQATAADPLRATRGHRLCTSTARSTTWSPMYHLHRATHAGLLATSTS